MCPRIQQQPVPFDFDKPRRRANVAVWIEVCDFHADYGFVVELVVELGPASAWRRACSAARRSCSQDRRR
jgi:hypothetical protein